MTSLALHRLAEREMAEGDMHMARGDEVAGRVHWHAAAVFEHATFSTIAIDKPRTRGITAVSAVACMIRSGDKHGAVRYADEFKAAGIEGWAVADIEDLL